MNLLSTSNSQKDDLQPHKETIKERASSKQRVTPVQNLLKEKIDALTCDLEALNKRTSLGLTNESELHELNCKRSLLQKNQQILKKTQLNQNRQSRFRMNRKRKLKEICVENPTLKEKLRIKEKVCGKNVLRNNHKLFFF